MTTKTAAQRGTAVSVKSLAITAICLVLVYVFTAVVNIRLPFAPNGGLIHLGNVPLFVAAILFGKRTGMIAGGIGMALFDLLSGWTLWAPFTLVIVGCMGLVSLPDREIELWLSKRCSSLSKVMSAKFKTSS